MSTSMTLNLIYAVVFTKLVTVLTQDLCSLSTIDSIAYIDDTKQFFITSGNYYYVVKESDMTPRAGKKLVGFPKVDAAFYLNWMNCPPSPDTYHERDVGIVSYNNTSSENRYLTYDVSSAVLDVKANVYGKHHLVSKIQVSWNKPVDAMFGYPPHEVYALQGNRYAGIDWKSLCSKKDSFAIPMAVSSNVNSDFETTRKIDAITYKDGTGFYVFTGDQYYILSIDKQKSGKGKFVRISKSTSKSIRNDFLKCGPSAPTEKPVPPITPPVPVPSPSVPEPTNAITDKPTQQTDAPKTDAITESPSNDEEKKKTPWLWIIIGIILLIIIIIIIIILCCIFMRRKRKEDEEKSMKSSKSSLKSATSGVSSRSANSAKSDLSSKSAKSSASVSSRRSRASTASNAKPTSSSKIDDLGSKSTTSSKKKSSSNFDDLAAKSTTSSQQSKRSKFDS